MFGTIMPRWMTRQWAPKHVRMPSVGLYACSHAAQTHEQHAHSLDTSYGSYSMCGERICGGPHDRAITDRKMPR